MTEDFYFESSDVLVGRIVQKSLILKRPMSKYNFKSEQAFILVTGTICLTLPSHSECADWKIIKGFYCGNNDLLIGKVDEAQRLLFW